MSRKPLTANEIKRAKQAAQEIYDSELASWQERQENLTKLERWQANIIEGSNFLASLSDVFYLGFVNVLSSMGIGVIWLASIVAEIASVYEGFQVLHPEIWIAILLATILVFSVQFLEFSIQKKEKVYSDTHHKKYKFTLNQWRKNIFAWITGSEIEDSPAKSERTLQTFAMVGVIIFAFVGASHEIVLQYEGVWYEAYIGIFSSSDAEQFNVWVTVLIRAILFVTMARVFTQSLIDNAQDVSIISKSDKPDFHSLFKLERVAMSQAKYNTSMARVSNHEVMEEVEPRDVFVQELPEETEHETEHKSEQKRTAKRTKANTKANTKTNRAKANTKANKNNVLSSKCLCGCDETIDSIKGRKPKKFFSNACRMRYNRTKANT